MAWDAAAWTLALVAGAVLRYEVDLGQIDVVGLRWTIVVALAAQLVIGTLLQLYRGRHYIGTVDDAINVSAAIALTGVVLFGVNLLPAATWVPRSVPLIAILIALMLAVSARLAVRRYRERSSRPDLRSSQRVIIFGAGNEGQQLVRSMLSGPRSGYLPVALLDDDPGLRRRRVSGVPVRGTRADIGAVAGTTRADLLIIAHRQADGGVMRAVARAATDAGLGVKVLPSLPELLRPWVGISDLRDLDIADLLGRRPVEIDLAASAGYLAGRRILVTGAGGSIGSELCRQIHRFGPAELLMLDRDESALHATQLSIHGTALLDSPNIILADIRDSAAIASIFMHRRPDVVFHAAALKHLPILERYPEEAWKSNVLGTHNVLEAAKLAEVDRFVNISTDKAANPTSVLGRSKRIGERLVANAAMEVSGTYLSVRFGNVLGSRGSVLTTFAEQLATGVPITVTHPDVTRFFMTIPEAVHLVLYAAAIGRPGEALVLDMGSPVRIADVARQMMDIAGRSTEIVYTGLREGEKLHEELFGEHEIDDRPIHPSVSHVEVPRLEPLRAVQRAQSVGVERAMVTLTCTAGGAETDQHSVGQIAARAARSGWLHA
ncbi:nucleoside-diphosphate sugar epimerase/dehydratase [Pseudonocardia sp. H11422]|uniref:nucleoside-diphosphate sugar epimerase/dehydratase n=1 Tax=Pseudonocardia sp. H11422 TaxID=2835866 RepID=UPI0027E3964A|nr:nucleoside-diphosphate sugar epimerase/dehydratase [Pseudonocardia sp. H11422]